MKNKIILLVALLSIFVSNAQEETAVIDNNNELKINAVYLMAGMPEFTYERILNVDSSIGLSVAVSLVEDPIYDFAITPYYRVYFGENTASGFFIELNGSFYSEEINKGDYDEVYVEDEFGGYYTSIWSGEEGSKLGLGLGLAVGTKLMLKRGWFGEIYGGAGRNFLNTNKITGVYPRGGITLGRRF